MSNIKSLDALNKYISGNTGKNLLINGDFSAEAVINQRGFDGNWAGATEGVYGFDRWKKSGTDIIQIVEAGGYKPSSVHTLSGIGIISSQITSPSSGNWAITVVNTATNVQLELGDTATDFEVVNPADQLARCQRYYQRIGGSTHTPFGWGVGLSTVLATLYIPLPVELRTIAGDAPISGAITAVSGSPPVTITSGAYKPGESSTSLICIHMSAADFVLNQLYTYRANNDVNAYVEIDAEI